VIRLWFSEQPELALTRITLRDDSGKTFSIGKPESDRTDPLLILVPVSSLPAGRYTVAWQTAASDGHPTHGTFSFDVIGGTPPAGASSQPQTTARDSAPLQKPNASPSTDDGKARDGGNPSSIGNSLARVFSFVGLFLLIGAVSFRTVVLPRARDLDVELKHRMEDRAAILGFAASIVVIGSGLSRMFLELAMMRAMPGMQAMSLSDMAMHTHWGFAFRLSLVAAVVAMIAFAFAARPLRGAWAIAGLAALVLALTPALGGHAAATPKFRSLLIVADYLHVIAGATWLGSLFAIMVVGVPLAAISPDDRRWASIATLVNSFSPLALASVAAVVISGLLSSWVHLDSFSDFWQTTYGQVLGVKLALVALTIGVGAYNFRVVQPRLTSNAGIGRLSRSATIELGTGLLVLLVTGFLTGISP
jgi:copper transport protein